MKTFPVLFLNVAIAALVAVSAPAGTASHGWRKWAESPPKVAVSVAMPTLDAGADSLVQVSLADGLGVGQGDVNGCGNTVVGPTFFANLNVRREYRLVVVASNLASLNLQLEVRPPAQLLKNTGSGAVPRSYMLYINGQNDDSISVSHNCGYYTNSWLVEIRDRQGANWVVDDQSKDPGPAPGDGAPLELGPGKNLLTNMNSLLWSVSLGRLYDGLAAGRLRFSESGLSRDAFTPRAIFYAAGSALTRSQVELISAQADKSMRQVKAYQCLVDILDPWTFNAPDIQDLPTLASRLKTETNGISLFLSNNLAQATQIALTNYTNGASSPEPLRSLLVHDLNNLIAGQSIYSSNVFQGISLRAETQFLLGQNSKGVDLLRMNRLLLEDAYAQELARRPYQTELKFYLPTQVGTQTNMDGVYTNITGEPFVAWQLQNPQPLSYTNLLLIESRNQVQRTNSISFTPQAGQENWILTTGSGPEQKVETRSIGLIFSGTSTNRFETNVVRYQGSTNVYKCIENYQLFYWGWELVESRVDPDGANLVTSFEFYDDPADDPAIYGKLHIIRNPDGNWEVREYDTDWLIGALQYVLRPFNGIPGDPTAASISNCEVTEYGFWGDSGSEWAIDHFVGGANTGFDNLIEEIAGTVLLDSTTQAESQGMDHNGMYGIGGHFTGNYVVRGRDDAEKGYAGHVFFQINDKGPDQVSYFHGGVYDPVTRTFTIGTGGAQAGPDWRESVVTLNRQTYPLKSGTQVTSLEGQILRPSDWGFVLHPYKSTRRSTIYHKGSVALTEVAVFTGWDTSGAIFEPVERYIHQCDTLGHTTNITKVDASSSSVSRVVYEANYCDPTNGKDGELLRWNVDEQGIRSEYTYDSLKRVVQIRVPGITNSVGSVATVSTNLLLDAVGRTRSVVTSAGSLTLSNYAGYDLAGRLVLQIDEAGLVTSNSYSVLNGLVTTTTRPDGGTVIRSMNIDRRLSSITGTAGISEYHQYSLDDRTWLEARLVDTTHYGTENSPRWIKSISNILGLPSMTQKQDFESQTIIETFLQYSGWLHQPLWKQETGKATVFYEIDYDGRLAGTCVGSRSPDDTGRIQGSWQEYRKSPAGHWFLATTNITYLTPYSDEVTVSSMELARLSGFPNSSIIAETTSYDADTNATTTTTYLTRSARQITVVADTAQSSLNATNLLLMGLLMSESTPQVASPTRHYYDALGREIRTVTPLGFATTREYNARHQLAAVTDSAGNRTAYEYYNNGEGGAGQIRCITGPTGRKTFQSYTLRGELHRVWGDVPYPEERAYNIYGELVHLFTFRNGSNWRNPTWPGDTNNADVTTWVYQEHSGLLTNKTDAAGRSVSYTYQNGLLQTTRRARGVSSYTYYNSYGDPFMTYYDDGVTPMVTFDNYNRMGLPGTIMDGSGTWLNTYDHAGRLVLSTNTAGPLCGIAVSNHFAALHGRDSLQVLGTAPGLLHSFGYDSYGRLATVAAGDYWASYGYLPNSDLLENTIFRSNTTEVLRTTRTWEYGMRLRGIANVVSGQPVSTHEYLYDSLHRRVQATLEDGTLWKYDYNDRNELIDAKRFWSDWTPYSGQQFGYLFDSIGNRMKAWEGGDNQGGNLREIQYSANELNQYTNIVTPGYKHISGVALATNTVTVNSGTAERRGEWFDREITINNAGAPVWQTVAAVSGNVTSNGGFAFPKNQQALSYDADGNLTHDGTWAYEWDGENRLVSMWMTNFTGLDASNRLRLDFAYDYMGRRFSKTVSTWDSATETFTNSPTQYFVYDLGSWNLLATLNPQLSAINAFLWGQDLSGTMTEAGGVGGYLGMMEVSPSGITNSHFAMYGGNGNVIGLIASSSRTASACYDYSPFGKTLRLTGPLASLNPIRFSSKFTDSESELINYGTRLLSVCLGRWISVDPIGEEGGNNLYCFVLNASPNAYDPVGTSLEQDLVDNLEWIDGFIPTALNGVVGIPSGEVVDQVIKGLKSGSLSGIRQFGAALTVGQSALNFGTLGHLASGVLDNAQLFQGSPLGDFLIKVGNRSTDLISIQAELNYRETGTFYSEQFWQNVMMGNAQYPRRAAMGDTYGTEKHHMIELRHHGLEWGHRVILPAAYHALINKDMYRWKSRSGDFLLTGYLITYGKYNVH